MGIVAPPLANTVAGLSMMHTSQCACYMSVLLPNICVAPLIIPCDHPRHWVLKMHAQRDQLNNCIMNALKVDASCLSVCDWANVKRWSKTSVNIWRWRNLNFHLMTCWLPCLSSNLAIYCFRASCNVEVESQLEIGGYICRNNLLVGNHIFSEYDRVVTTIQNLKFVHVDLIKLHLTLDSF